MEAIGLVAAAAAFGYLATVAHKRWEVLRSVALELDADMRRAFDAALVDDDPATVTADVGARVQRAQMRTAAFPPSLRARVEGQLFVAKDVVDQLQFLISEQVDDVIRIAPQAHLQASVAAVREVIAPLLLPPPLFRRRPGEPRSYPAPYAFAAIKIRHQGQPIPIEDAMVKTLREALGQYLEALPEALEDHYPPQ